MTNDMHSIVTDIRIHPRISESRDLEQEKEVVREILKEIIPEIVDFVGK